ncbi:MAG: hypothetical protein SGJ18_15105 [Pseudomonadota bacterium]|nr:hypothetical protein [Pseudomonadota bacterium]
MKKHSVVIRVKGLKRQFEYIKVLSELKRKGKLKGVWYISLN